MDILDCVHLGSCTFGMVSIRDSAIPDCVFRDRVQDPEFTN